MPSRRESGDRMRYFRRAGKVTVPMPERWRQIFRAGEAELHHFTPAELAAVSLQREAMPPERDPVLSAATPPQTPAGAGSGNVLGGLERQGFVRPWPPATPAGAGAHPIPEEYPGWAVSPEDQRRPVALAGDLAIITATRSMPAWIAEVSVAADPTWPDPDDASWNLVARIYARYTPPSGLVERPAGPDGTTAPYVLLRDDQVLYALVEWCGADAAAAPVQTPRDEADTASLAAGFTRLAQVRVALPHADQVRVRSLVVASGEGGHWLLEGKYWERAVAISPDDLGKRISAIVKSALTDKA